MKINVIILVWMLVAYMVAYTVMNTFSLPVPVLLASMVVGQAFLVFTVYRTLTDHYQTKKRFKDWYGDVSKDELDKIQ